MLEDNILLMESAKSFEPDVIIHLAAQAGVRYSLKTLELTLIATL